MGNNIDVRAKTYNKIAMERSFAAMIAEYKSTCVKLEERIRLIERLISCAESPARVEAHGRRRMLLLAELWDMLAAIREMEEYEQTRNICSNQ